MSINLKTVRYAIAIVLCGILMLTSPVFCFQANVEDTAAMTSTVYTVD